MIYIASDHNGFEAKTKIIAFMEASNLDYQDLGPFQFEKTDDYPDYAFPLAERVVAENAIGILLCGSGTGICIAANKVKGARAAYVESVEHAIKAREDDDANILVLDSMTFSPVVDFPIIETFLNTKFSEAERHIRRIKKISDYENK